MDLASLIVPRLGAATKIAEQIEHGRVLLNLDRKAVSNDSQWYAEQSRIDHWRDYTVELLRRLFDTSTEADKFENAWSPSPIVASGGYDHETCYYDRLRDHLAALTSLASRLDLIPEASTQPTSSPRGAVARGAATGRRVFIVHGHDREARERVARTISKVGYEPIILVEQANRGMTVIEKLEASAGDVVFAVVLLTPDDVGRAAATPDVPLRPRARQNVLLELGYFVALLGRGRVCALYRGDVETPSDFAGVIWIPLDDYDAWPLTLCKEMRAAGLDVDMNRL